MWACLESNPQPRIFAPWFELNQFKGKVKMNECRHCLTDGPLFLERTCLGWMGACEWCGCVHLIAGGKGYEV